MPKIIWPSNSKCVFNVTQVLQTEIKCVMLHSQIV